jgi:hypothetical protein
MSYTKQEIIHDITVHIEGASYGNCYVGVTADIDRRFLEHNVSLKTDRWICRIADSEELAREIQQHFIAAGMEGGKSAGGKMCNIVYVYRKAAATFP